MQKTKENNNKEQYQQLYELLSEVGEPEYIIRAEPRSLCCLVIGAIIGQKISFARARKARSNLYTQLGTNFNVTELEKLTEDDWLSMGLEDFHIKTIQNFREMHNKGEINLEDIKQVDKLISIKGIGSWTVDNIKIMYQVHNNHDVPDIILMNDYIVKKALKSIYKVSHVTMSFVNELKELWGEHMGIIHWYIWRYSKGIIY